jgi:hypothetical protein
MTPESIRPARFSDLDLLLEFVGLGERSKTIWNDMKRLTRAHVQAGQRLRHLLEDEIESADLTALTIAGELKVELDVVGAGSLGIYRVQEIANASVDVPSSWLRVAQLIEGDLWQG